ncbi:hypothetical protein Dimus_024649 [Dionaea muscipula]
MQLPMHTLNEVVAAIHSRNCNSKKLRLPAMHSPHASLQTTTAARSMKGHAQPMPFSPFTQQQIDAACILKRLPSSNSAFASRSSYRRPNSHHHMQPSSNWVHHSSGPAEKHFRAQQIKKREAVIVFQSS